jgi:hypothetical protein
MKNVHATGDAFLLTALRREQTALQTMKFLAFSIFLWVIFALLNPDPHSHCGSGSSRPKSMQIRTLPKTGKLTSNSV